MDRQCGRQLYDRTCCAKQMWERLRPPMNTKQPLARNPQALRSAPGSCPGAPTLGAGGAPCQGLGLPRGGCGSAGIAPPTPPSLRSAPWPGLGLRGERPWASYPHPPGASSGPLTPVGVPPWLSLGCLHPPARGLTGFGAAACHPSPTRASSRAPCRAGAPPPRSHRQARPPRVRPPRPSPPTPPL